MNAGRFCKLGGVSWLAGHRFGRLVAVELLPKENQNRRWRCRCDCGGFIDALAHNLIAGKVSSCGCYLTQYHESRRKDVVYHKGYAFVKQPDHPRSHPTSGRVREHILVMELKLGRSLRPGEEAHHKNGLRADNRPENLELWLRSQPTGARICDLVDWAKNLLELYSDHKD